MSIVMMMCVGVGVAAGVDMYGGVDVDVD